MHFADLELAEPLCAAIEALGYRSPTLVQQRAIPAVLAGRDVLATAATGSGKTAAFALPLLQRLAAELPPDGPCQVRALVLVPTRELAAQVAEACRRYGEPFALISEAVFGGVPLAPQAELLRPGVDVLAATPGRLLELVRQGAVRLEKLKMLVLDEADRMLDLGFAADLDALFALLPKRRQTLLFSATFPDTLRRLAQARLKNPLTVDAHPRNAPAASVRQWVVPVDKRRKPDLLRFMMKDRDWRQALVFVRTRQGVDELLAWLQAKGIAAGAIHGDLSQSARQQALDAFKAGELRLLVATDVAARGIDIGGLPVVVNFDLPTVAEDYVHRIGRTGRAGADGEAVSLVSADEVQRLAAIETLIKKPLSRDEEPGFEPKHQLPPTSGPLATPRPPRRPAAPRPGGVNGPRGPGKAPANAPARAARRGPEKAAAKPRNR